MKGDAGKILSKQFLRSGTSIGANCSEAKYGQSSFILYQQVFYRIKGS